MIKNLTFYEWCWEEIDEQGNVVDGNSTDSLDKTSQRLEEDDKWLHEDNQKGHFELVLIWNVGNEVEGTICRAWAYVEDGVLPEYFDNGVKVPKRFIKEFDEWKNLKSK